MSVYLPVATFSNWLKVAVAFSARKVSSSIVSCQQMKNSYNDEARLTLLLGTTLNVILARVNNILFSYYVHL